jgi:hypothetical protein
MTEQPSKARDKLIHGDLFQRVPDNDGFVLDPLVPGWIASPTLIWRTLIKCGEVRGKAGSPLGSLENDSAVGCNSSELWYWRGD